MSLLMRVALSPSKNDPGRGVAKEDPGANSVKDGLVAYGFAVSQVIRGSSKLDSGLGVWKLNCPKVVDEGVPMGVGGFP